LSGSANVTVHILCEGETANMGSIKESSLISVVNDAISIAPDSDTVVVPVLDNDESFGGELQVVAILYDAQFGSCEVYNGSSVAYTPNSDNNGSDSCVYRACSVEGDCDSAVLSISVETDIDSSPLVSNLKRVEVPPKASRRSSSIYGAVMAVVVAVAGMWVFVVKRKRCSGGFPKMSDPWHKTTKSADGIEASSLTNDNPSETIQHQNTLQYVSFGDGGHLMSKSQTDRSPGAPEARALFPDEPGAKNRVPITPANSLFSVSSSNSKRCHEIGDVVDL